MQSDLPQVVFFGDSRARDWPAPDVAGCAFVNRGIGGQTCLQIYERIATDIAPLMLSPMPGIIVLQAGINDLKTIPLAPEKRDAIVAGCKETLQRIVAELTRLGATVILSTIFPNGEVPADRVWSGEVAVAVGEVNAFLAALVSDRVILLDAHAALVGEDGRTRPEYSRDLMHLTPAGYARLNAELVPHFKRVLTNFYP